MNFLTNYWYAAGWSSEITGKPLARRILDRPVALFRTAGGKAAAFDDCCPHRMVPLSRGTVEGESLRCGYHGLRFDCSGKCVEVPGQANIPPRARVHAYPLVERWNFAWIWMGEPAAANPDLIPELPWLVATDWAYSHGSLSYACNYALLLDNLIDLSHTTFVHQRTIGTGDVAKTPVKTTSDAGRVLVERVMNDTEPSVLYRKSGDFTGKVDRWQRIEYTPPTHIIIDAGAVPAGTGDKKRGIDTRIINIITPETPKSTFHFWAFARDFKIDDTAMTDYIQNANALTFNEDKVLIDGQQRNIDERPGQRMLDNNADSGVVLARRMIDRLLREQNGERATA
ncbi:MAG: aromatic ring-hydroxylating dioxygenase subunit alpha [Betaproteobacteria bacterium]|nr:aromatic ring-hydroxylating dioxygenase subunit alpha [Betaproteobacteria bacterium]